MAVFPVTSITRSPSPSARSWAAARSVRQGVDHPAIPLLREGLGEGARAQAGLHVAAGDPRQEGRLGGGAGRPRVAVDEHDGGAELLEEPGAAGQGGGHQLGGALVRGHQVEVMVRDQAQVRQGPVQHLPVLAGYHQHVLELRIPCERAHHRGHLGGLGTGPDHGDDAGLGSHGERV